MKGMAATKYHFILGMVENVSTFMPGTSALLLALSMTLAGRYVPKKPTMNVKGRNMNVIQLNRHTVLSVCFVSDLWKGWRERTADA